MIKDNEISILMKITQNIFSTAAICTLIISGKNCIENVKLHQVPKELFTLFKRDICVYQ